MAITKFILMIFFAILVVLMTSCVMVPIDRDVDSGTVGSAVIRARDVNEYLEDYWEQYIVPEINDRRVSLETLIQTAQSNGWDYAGGVYGEIRGEIGASYTFIVYGTVVVRETNTESRNGFIIVETENHGAYEIRISIGPALSGAAIRDSLRFVDFNQFVNQVDFARLATELNNRGNQRALENADIFALDGKTIEFTGAFVAPGDSDVISIMPIFLEVK